MLHLQAAGKTWMKLKESSGRLEAESITLKCRWDPTSRYLVVLDAWAGKYDKGAAFIFDTATSWEVHDCWINHDAYWPEWCGNAFDFLPPHGQARHGPASGLSIQLQDETQQCFVHDLSGRLTLVDGEPTWEECGHRWSRTSPDGALITTLLANVRFIDAFYPEDVYRLGNDRSAHAFQHYHTASAKEASVPLAGKSCTKPLSGQLVKSHPFLCAWLPGTAIYAAAALGHVYVVDGMHNSIIKVWPADSFEMGEDDDPAGSRRPRCEPEFAGLSWSPDGLHLAWVFDGSLRMVSFFASLEELIARQTLDEAPSVQSEAGLQCSQAH